jgi:hypothetical protein
MKNYTKKLLTKKISFYKKLNSKQKEELWDLLSDYEKYRISLKKQKKIGFGKDKFTLNEFGIRPPKLKRYKNIKQWDKEQYKYNKKHGQTHLDKSYKIYMFGDWCRLIENKKLIYGELLSLSSYVFDEVSQKLSKFEDGLYPHSFDFKFIKEKKKRKNPLTGKFEYFSTLETNTKAYGKEEELERFSKFKTKFEYEILQPKIKKYILKNFKNRTYRIVQKKETFDNFHIFLFSDKDALKNCSFNNFLNDFNSLQRDDIELKKVREKFVKYSKNYLMDNFM